MSRFTKALAAASLFALAAAAPPAQADEAQIARGGYLVSVSGCNDCHTAGYFFGKPDMERYLEAPTWLSRFRASAPLSART